VDRSRPVEEEGMVRIDHRTITPSAHPISPRLRHDGAEDLTTRPGQNDLSHRATLAGPDDIG
jgi:hypothetical protein